MNWKLNSDYHDQSKIGRSNIVEVGYLLKLVYRGNAFLSSAGKRKKYPRWEKILQKQKESRKLLCIFMKLKMIKKKKKHKRKYRLFSLSLADIHAKNLNKIPTNRIQ